MAPAEDIIDLTADETQAHNQIDLTQDGPSQAPLEASRRPFSAQQRPIDIDTSDDEVEVEEDRDRDEDDDLRRAIALSLQDQDQDHNAGNESSKSRTVAADHASTSIASAPTTITTTASSSREQVEQNSQPHAGVGGYGMPFLGLDRKQMELERLARLKRKRGDVEEDQWRQSQRAISPPPLRRSNVALAADATTPGIGVSTSSNAAALTKPPLPPPPPLSTTSTQILQFPNGTTLQTHASGYPDAQRTTTFASLISPASQLESCLLSSFIWDFDWLFPHFDTRSTKFLLVMHAKSSFQRSQILDDFKDIGNVRVCFPPMEGRGTLVNCMHSKLMLLFYPAYARVVVPTANLTGVDWGVGRVMENTLWCIDLPILAVGNSNGVYAGDGHSSKEKQNEMGKGVGAVIGVGTDFKKSLLTFLGSQTVPDDVLRKLETYNFSNTANIGFVHSIGGSHAGEVWRETGLCGLGKTITSLGLAASEPIQLDFVTSSVGSLDDQFMRSIYLAAQGDDGLTEYTLRTAKTLPAKRLGTASEDRVELVQRNAGKDWRNNFRFYFPSADTVGASNGGPASAGTICFSEKWWKSEKFPRGNMKDCVSVRNGLLMHNKIVFVRFKQLKQVGDARHAGWTYVGSGNLSESAWGRLVEDKATKAPKLNCRNWECGVVLPVLAPHSVAKSAYDEQSAETVESLEVCSEITPVPMRTTTSGGYQGSSKKPWFFGGA